MAAYYNEHDAKAAAWLRELVRRNLIAPGDVDERSIVDVRSDDLRGYEQCHFFAGIGVWSYALRSAGWSDDRPVWTGSCPCQPFSAAGKGEAYADERHLWPHWYRLIGERRPPTIFGEQVDAAIRTGWLDDVCLSLEALGYAVGAVDFPACSVGAPHIRQRIYFVGHASGERSNGRTENGPRQSAEMLGEGCEAARAVADDDATGRARQRIGGLPENGHAPRRHDADRCGAVVRMGDAECAGSQRRDRSGDVELHRRSGADGSVGPSSASSPMEHAASGGFWRDAEWIACRDGKARPVESGTFPLVTGAPARVVRLRGYGNAINAEQARAFIEAYLR